MKRNNKILAIIIILIILTIAIFLLFFQDNKNTYSQLNCKNYSYENCPSECVVCPPCAACSSISCNSKEFCKSIGFNESWYDNVKQKTYCTPEQKKAKICPEYYSATCGWFNSSIKCFKYPCAQTFSNPCFACANVKVEYYTNEECPK